MWISNHPDHQPPADVRPVRAQNDELPVCKNLLLNVKIEKKKSKRRKKTPFSPTDFKIANENDVVI